MSQDASTLSTAGGTQQTREEMKKPRTRDRNASTHGLEEISSARRLVGYNPHLREDMEPDMDLWRCLRWWKLSKSTKKRVLALESLEIGVSKRLCWLCQNHIKILMKEKKTSLRLSTPDKATWHRIRVHGLHKAAGLENKNLTHQELEPIKTFEKHGSLACRLELLLIWTIYPFISVAMRKGF